MNFGLKCLSEYVDGILSGRDVEEVRGRIIEEAENHTFDLRLVNGVMDEVRNALRSLGYRVIDVRARLNYKAISGVSQGLFHLIFEVGLNYDEILDVPYIPGSTIKGILRSRLYSLAGVDGGELFGDVGHEGYVIVSDAYPVSSRDGKLLIGDIVNPHYYRGGEPVRSEYEVQPIPIKHLSVRDGVSFRFVIGVDKGAGVSDVIRERLGVGDAVELVSVLLFYSMRTGLGARSTKGYGVFEVEGFEVV